LKLRLIECYIPKHIFAGLDGIVKDDQLDIIWTHVEEEANYTLIRILTTLKSTEKIVDKLNNQYGGSKFRIIVFQPTTTVPEVIEEPTEKNGNIPERLSRQEIYGKMYETTNISKEYFLMIVLSAIVASIGIWKNDVAVIIGSMIIAPLLSPNIALSYSITVADSNLAKKSIKNLLLGTGIVLILSIVLGHFLPITPANPQISSRMNLDIEQVIIALAAGIVGAISTISGISSAVVGVMIAIALLPPLVAFGLSVGAGYYIESIPILLLFIANIISINLSSVLLFFLYGISPYKWWEREKARKLTIIAISVWMSLLIMLIMLITVFR
jgi:uncharacterized hydrophobic protein (TIGR00341 family)